MLTGLYYPEVNGAINQSKMIISCLQGMVKFKVFCGSGELKANKKDVVESIDVYRNVYPCKSLSFNNLLVLLRVIINFIKVLDGVKIVHVHGVSDINLLLILISIIFRKKVLLKFTSYGFDDALTVKKKSLLKFQILKNISGFIAPSDAFINSCLGAGIRRNNISVIPNGVDVKKFSNSKVKQYYETKRNLGFNEDDIIVLFIGHFSDDKNPTFAFNVWSKLQELNDCFKLIMIGERKTGFEINEKLSQQIENFIDARKMWKNILFKDRVLDIEIYYQIADVLLMPSLREGMSNVLLEGMSSEVVVFANKLEGINTNIILNGINGFLLENKSVDCWVKKIIHELNVGNLEEIGRRAREDIIQNYSSDWISSQIYNLYKNL